jgi:hypothetical protein
MSWFSSEEHKIYRNLINKEAGSLSELCKIVRSPVKIQNLSSDLLMIFFEDYLHEMCNTHYLPEDLQAQASWDIDELLYSSWYELTRRNVILDAFPAMVYSMSNPEIEESFNKRFINLDKVFNISH